MASAAAAFSRPNSSARAEVPEPEAIAPPTVEAGEGAGPVTALVLDVAGARDHTPLSPTVVAANEPAEEPAAEPAVEPAASDAAEGIDGDRGNRPGTPEPVALAGPEPGNDGETSGEWPLAPRPAAATAIEDGLRARSERGRA